MENKKKYNGIEFDDDLDLDTYEAYYRNLDPQTGRWWQIDPKIEEIQDDISPYASMSDNPISKADPLGDVPCCDASAEAFITTQQLTVGANIALGGPENPFADIVSVGAEAVGLVWTLGTLINEGYNNLSPSATDAPSGPGSIQAMPVSTDVISPEAMNIPQTPTGPGGLVIPQEGPQLPAMLQAHGNSKSSSNAQHGYVIKEKQSGEVQKFGISGKALNQNGTSARANTQVNKMNKQAKADKYEAKVVKKNMAGREKALKWEKGKVRAYKKSNSGGNQPPANKLPKIEN